MITLAAPDPPATTAIAKKIAALLRPGDCLLLSGALGAGKTWFARALAQSLGVRQDVTSPTFSIVNIYEATDMRILHIDAYRLAGAREFRDLGLDEFFDESVAVVEWGEKVRDEFPDHLNICFQFGPQERDSRKISLRPAGAWADRLPPDLCIQNRIA